MFSKLTFRVHLFISNLDVKWCVYFNFILSLPPTSGEYSKKRNYVKSDTLCIQIYANFHFVLLGNFPLCFIEFVNVFYNMLLSLDYQKYNTIFA